MSQNGRFILLTPAIAVCLCGLLAVIGGCPPLTSDPNTTPDPNGVTPDPNTNPNERSVVDTCKQCHASLTARYQAGTHKAFADACLTCHENGRQHAAAPIDTPATIHFGLDACSSCHTDQGQTYLHDDASKPGHYGGSISTSKYLEWPHYQYLLGGHGFTKQYNEERAHAYLLKDHIDTQRKQATTCLQCKSTPVAYYWNESRRGAKQFDKTMDWAKVVDRIRADWPETVDYGAGCNHCHDPHDGKFRLIRKGVIAAILERGTDPYSKSRNVIPASEDELSELLNARGSDGELTAEARRLAGTLTCAQCHIEYVCGQGADRATTGEIRDDVPWRKLGDLEAYYQGKFGLQQDWKHSITGLPGIKPQHPETEEYWASVHYRLDMSCADCHMTKSTSASGGYTSHWLTSPLKNNTTVCGKCHEDVQAELFAVQDAFYAEARVVEDLLFSVLQKIEAANSSGLVPAADLAAAKSLFMSALTWWEWTAVSENSMGSHYPDQAREQMQYAKDKANEALLLLP